MNSITTETQFKYSDQPPKQPKVETTSPPSLETIESEKNENKILTLDIQNLVHNKVRGFYTQNLSLITTTPSSPTTTTRGVTKETENESKISSTDFIILAESPSESDNGETQNGGGKPKKKFTLWKYRGYFFAMLSSLAYTISALLAKYLTNYCPITIALWKMQGVLLPAIPLVIYRQFFLNGKWTHKSDMWSPARAAVTLKPPVSKFSKFKMISLLLLRSILACNALLLHFYSLNYLDMGDSMVISSSSPIFAYTLAYFLLGEACGVVPIVASVTTLVGVMVIIKPPFFTGGDGTGFQMDHLRGAAIALASTLLATVSYIILRHLRKVHYSTTMITFGTWGTFENLVLALIFGVFALPHGLKDWLLAGALASVTFFGQVAIIMALKSEQTGPIALIRSFDIIFGFSWQMIAWRTIPDIFSVVGALIVLSAMILTAFRKWLASLPDDNRTKLRLWFILK